ncbi:MAG: carboxymuconolactone decarboxylase family protein [Candidatus Tectimicrobiota bacterium]
MASLNERFQQGLEVRERLAGGEGRSFRGATPAAYELAPDMYRISTECLYGSIWSRPGLDIKYRAIATFTVAAIQRAPLELRAHLRNALNVGVTPEEIIEICMMIAFYGGIPAAYHALAVAKESFEERGMHVTLPETFDPSLTPEKLYAQGLARHQEMSPDVFGYHPTEPTPEERDLDILMQEYLWGAIWTRPGLDTKSRIVCGLAAILVIGGYDLSTRRMIERAVRQGLTRTEIMEIGMQLAFYVGIFPARAFMHIANSVFRSPEFASSSS